jgi:hypothetical protein
MRFSSSNEHDRQSHQVAAAPAWAAVLCCLLLVFAGPAAWGTTVPDIVRPLTTSSEEESRTTSVSEIKEAAPRPREDRSASRVAHAGATPHFRPARLAPHSHTTPRFGEPLQTEQDGWNGLGAPLLC